MAGKDDTTLITAGRDSEKSLGAVNLPVYRASTILFPTYAALRAAHPLQTDKPYYGRRGTPTSWAFADAVAEIEGGSKAWVYPSGLAAIAGALLAFLDKGDHLLTMDSVYEPTRVVCEKLLKKKGVEVDYFDPLIGEGIAALFRPNTAAVFLETPGSLTFETPDVPAIAAVAKSRGATVILDNTWASPLFFKPFSHGVDVSIQAATKYIAGHSDAMLGVATANEAAWPRLRDAAGVLGQCAGPDDVFLGLRGLRTLGVRLRRHQETALTLAAWLEARPEVRRVLYPALPSDPGHAIWTRDFSGASGLFGVAFERTSETAIAAMLDGFKHFGIGYSWGGFESLALPAWPSRGRTATTWRDPEPILRLHAGLEDVDDLIADLDAGLARFRAAL